MAGDMIANGFYARMAKIIHESDALFYRHFDDRRSYTDLASALRRLNPVLGPLREARVAAYVAKGFDAYAGVFATILTGNTWIPLNPAAPDSRNAEIIQMAAPEVILIDRPLGAAARAEAERRGARVVSLSEQLAGADASDLVLPDFRDDALSMIYFTSGSTGRPKGVQVTHRNYILNVLNILDLVDLGPGEVFADYHDLGFVISVPVLFPCVMCGGALSPGINMPDVLLPLNHMAANGVTVLITVPSTIARIRKGGKPDTVFPPLNVLISCGEPLHLDVLDFAISRMAPKRIYNFYGSTEVAPWTFHHPCQASDVQTYRDFGYIPIGNPIKGNEIRLSEEGELWVSSDQVVPGYLGGVNAEQFPTIDGKRWYKTGDKVIRHEDVYICKGRLDSQIKVGGYRVELMDIEAHLRGLEGVEAAVCFADGDDEEKLIVAVLHTQKDYKLPEVRSFLGDRLPSYMMPRRVHCLADAPLNKSGKIDRAGLRKMYSKGRGGSI